MAKQRLKLLVSSPPVLCPECRLPCLLVSADGKRYVLKHANIPEGHEDCKHTDKLWVIPQQFISATEA